ncbi:IS481 family transposase, partial [Pseudomonas aeruginosa]
MSALGIEWRTHLHGSKDGSRTTARSKGKVERAFRTVKEAHATLYHFHKPETEAQANEWLLSYLTRTYNQQTQRAETLSRVEHWITQVPTEGNREVCSSDQFCRFAREPERRNVRHSAQITTDGTAYEREKETAVN